MPFDLWQIHLVIRTFWNTNLRLFRSDVKSMKTLEIERGGGIAAWRQIEEFMALEISSGRLQPGQQIDTESHLAAHFSVNRHTVRRALLALSERGLLSIEQGRGTFVRDQVIDYPIGKRTRFSEIITAQQHEPSGRLIESEDVAAPREVAERLGIRAGTKVLRLDTLSFADEVPISTSSSWFPLRLFPDFLEVYRRTASISAAFAHYGHGDYRRAWTAVSARMPTRKEADLLRQSPKRPLLLAESVNVDAQGTPIQYAQARFAGERVQVVVES